MTGLERWHEFVEQGNPELLEDILAPDCVFYSPLVHTPQRGRDITRLYLTGAMQVLNKDFRYVKEVAGPDHAGKLLFQQHSRYSGIHSAAQGDCQYHRGQCTGKTP